jgi:hypothetical protein
MAEPHKTLISVRIRKEIKLCRNKNNHFVLLSLVHSIKQVNSVNSLGLHFKINASFSSHLDHVLSIVNQRFSLLNQLQLQGTDVQGLTAVFDALILTKIVYASNARYSYVTGSS